MSYYDKDFNDNQKYIGAVLAVMALIGAGTVVVLLGVAIRFVL